MPRSGRISRVFHWLKTHRTWLGLSFVVIVLTIAGFALAEILKQVDADQIDAALRRITGQQIALALGLTALSFLTLSLYDVLGLHAIHKPQPYWRALLGSFTAYNLSHNFGFAPITGTAARWRAYHGTSLDAGDIARIVVIAGVTFWLGIFLLLGAFLVLFPGALRVHNFQLGYSEQAALGVIILGVIAVYLVLCIRQKGPVNLFGWTLPVPTPRQAAAQFLLAATDISIASAALLVLLPPESWFHYPDFLVAYVVAFVVALLTHAPGGIGVFETVILVTLPEVDRPSLVSALILYRLIYYWLPLVLAIALLGVNEVRMVKRRKSIQYRDREERIGNAHTL